MRQQKRIDNSSTSLSRLIEDACLSLVAILPFLVPFGLGMTIDLQGLTVVLTGVLAWIALLLRRRKQAWQMSQFELGLLAVYVVCCLLSLALHHTYLNTFGSWLVRIGSPALVAAVGCGLALCAIETERLVKWLYATCVLLAITAIPASFHLILNGERVGGLFHQADFLAVFMASGVLLGLVMWQLYPKLHKYILASQLLLIIVLILTETRAVIALLILIGFVIVLRAKLSWQKRVIITALAAIIIIIGGLGTQAILSHRLTDKTFADQSVQYRFALQHFGLKATAHEPLFGYGAGSLSTPLACPTLHNLALQLTCHQGYYFDSSHNVFLDRVLALGWIGGISFCLFVILALYKGLWTSGIERYLAYIALLIAAYYFTNPTDLEVELLFWVMLLRPFRKTSHASA